GDFIIERDIHITGQACAVEAAAAGEQAAVQAFGVRAPGHEVDGAGEGAFARGHRGWSLDHFNAFEGPGIPVAHASVGVGHAHAVVEVVHRAVEAAHGDRTHGAGQVPGGHAGGAVHRLDR